MSFVIMGAAFDLARTHGQQRLRAVERLNLRLFIHTENQGTVGRVEVEPDNVADLVDKQRIGRQLEGFDAVRLLSEGAPDAPTLEVEIPLCRAMLRVLQCVAAGGRLSSVCTMTLSTLASSIVRGAPGRGSSSSPSRPRSTKRRRHLPTVCTVTRSRAATALLLRPAAQPSTIRARNAKACAVLRRCA